MQFSDLALLALKYTKFLVSFLEPRVSFSSNFASLFSVITLLYFFIWSFICFWQKEPIKVQIFRLSTARVKIRQIPYVILQATSQFSFKCCITIQCHDRSFLWNFLAKTLYALDKKIPSKYKVSDFWVL